MKVNMSLPVFPTNTPPITRDDAINQILSSIAMEELGLSHIINTEGEKMQYALGTIPGVTGLEEPLTIDNLLELNRSVRDTLDSAMQSQVFLKAKMQGALSASTMRGPTGDTGPVGTILDSFDSIGDLREKHPTGSQGDAYLVAGELYVWNKDTQEWEKRGSLIGPTGATGARGPTGPTGPTGESGPRGDNIGVIKGATGSSADLPATGTAGDVYIVGGNELYVWNAVDNNWQFAGPFVPVPGPTGATGPTGAVGTILGSYDTEAELRRDHPRGSQGDAYLVGGELYVWNADPNVEDWEKVGDLSGPTGATGPAGPSASSYTIIPFASQVAPRTHVAGGKPSEVSLLGFGYGDARGQLSDLDDYSFPISSSDHSFNLDAYGNFQVVFSLPFDMTIRSIALTAGNWADFTPGGELFPYIQLYWAAPESNNFKLLTDAVAEPATPLGPNLTRANTMRSALKDGLEINLEAGTRIAIGALARITGVTSAQVYFLYYTGGIGLTPWIK